jgi:hypothetical protein
MLRFSATLACFLVAWYMAEKGLGLTPQYLFNDGFKWIYLVASVSWALTAGYIAVRGAP